MRPPPVSSPESDMMVICGKTLYLIKFGIAAGETRVEIVSARIDVGHKLEH
jgi:hypothetical protein